MKDDLPFLIAFVKEIGCNPELYDYNLEDYSIRKITESKWKKIAEKFKESTKDCKNKWKVIRSSYIRSLSIKTKKGAAGSKKDYYLTKYLKFLKPFTERHGRMTFKTLNMELTDDSNSLDESQLPSSLEIPDDIEEPDKVIERSSPVNQLASNTSDTKPNKRSVSPVEHYLIDSSNTECRKDGTDSERDTSELFLLSLVPHMKSMTQREQLKFQMGVLSLIQNIKYPDPKSK